MAHAIAKRWLGPLLFVLLACDPAAADPLVERSYVGDELQGPRVSEVIFSPQPPDRTHLSRIAELIASAQDSIDIALYSFRDTAIEAALRDAALRGVAIRVIYDDAKDDQKLDVDARARSRSGRLEAAGIDVRYVNTIMHHKFMIVDGPRDELERAATAILVTGSANWSDAAATRYDENTLVLQGHEELVLRMQGEFNLLWEHSRDFVIDDPLPFEPSERTISEADIVDASDTHAFFTSNNFALADATTFTATGRSTIADALIAAIAGATDSIWIASGHLRTRSIAEALMAKAWQQPDLDIRVYLDAQEYVSEAVHADQLEELEDCRLAAGNDEIALSACLERGYRFGYMIERAGVDVRYKYYSYRWSYVLAKQMHNKYMIIDGDELWTGSYNLSNNAEYNTMENMLMFSGPEHADLIDAYAENFESLWTTGRDAGQLEGLREEIASADLIPLLFEPMALEWEEVRELRALIRANCPRVHSFAFRSEPESHAACRRRRCGSLDPRTTRPFSHAALSRASGQGYRRGPIGRCPDNVEKRGSVVFGVHDMRSSHRLLRGRACWDEAVERL